MAEQDSNQDAGPGPNQDADAAPERAPRLDPDRQPARDPRLDLPPPTPPIVRLREDGAAKGVAERAGILLHGRSRTKQEMLDLTHGLDFGAETHLGIRWIAPYADHGLWYPGRYAEPVETNEPELTRSVERCHWLVLDASEFGRLGPGQIFIVGFSQGACIALEYAMRHPASAAAIVVFTGGLMGPSGSDWQPVGAKSLKGLNVFLTGSDVDEWITQERTEETAEVLTKLGAHVEMHIYKGRPHIVSPEEIVSAKRFLSNCMG